MRLRASEWQRVVARWGPFDGLIGAERELGQARAGSHEPEVRLWSHPTLATVGSSLRRIGERLAERSALGIRAVAMVPADGSEQWRSLMKYGLVVGRWEEGERVLETNVLGRWLPSSVRRPTALVVFPRAAGAVPRRVALSAVEAMEPVTMHAGSEAERRTTRGEGYIDMASGPGLRLAVSAGSYVYSLPTSDPSANGCLYRVVQPSEREETDSPDAVVAQELLLDWGKAARKSAVPIFTVSASDERWRPDPFTLWTVDHLVEEVTAAPSARTRKYRFDFARANSEIRRLGGRVAGAEWLGTFIARAHRSGADGRRGDFGLLAVRRRGAVVTRRASGGR
eukprot:1816196-Prymnesium_polylepis.1